MEEAYTFESMLWYYDPTTPTKDTCLFETFSNVLAIEWSCESYFGAPEMSAIVELNWYCIIFLIIFNKLITLSKYLYIKMISTFKSNIKMKDNMNYLDIYC